MMSLKGKHIVITAGATRAYLDDIRFLSNTATGRLGCEVAAQAVRRGARVTLVRGVDAAMPSLAIRKKVRILSIETIEDLSSGLQRILRGGRVNAMVHAMGVQDFVPVKREKGKRPTRSGAWTLKLKAASKVIDRVKRWSPRTTLVGFKLLSGAGMPRLYQESLRLKRRSGADAVVANEWKSVRTGEHKAYLVTDRGVEGARGKTQVARMIVNYLDHRIEDSSRR